MGSRKAKHEDLEKEFLQRFWKVARTDALDEIDEWINWDLRGVDLEATRVLKYLENRFRDETIKRLKDAWPSYEKRFVVELDTSNSTKSRDRILEKMVRTWIVARKPDPPPISPDNFRTEMPDALRYRYIVNFLDDGKRLNRMVLDEVRDPRSRMGQLFKLDKDCESCTVHLPLNKRDGGERSWKFRLVHQENGTRAELQVCTQLQVAWDKKDHFLIFELERRGRRIPPGDRIQMKHVSDQLYVVDRQLDELHLAVLERLRRNKTRR